MFKKNNLLVFVVLAFSCICFSQNKKIDSIKVLIERYEKKNENKPLSSSDSIKVNLYNKLCSVYDYQEPETAIKYAEIALQISKKMGYKRGEADAYFHFARIDGRSGKFDTSIENINKALKIYQALKIDVKIADCYNNLGVFCAQKGNLSLSTHYFLDALKIYEKLNDKNNLSLIYGNIGALYGAQNAYDKALGYYYKALELKENVGKNNIEFSGIYINIGAIYKDKNNIDKAIVEFNAAHKIALINNNTFMEALALCSLGNCYLDLKEYDKALALYLKAKKLYSDIPNDEGISNCNVTIGYSYFKKGEVKKALAFIQLALDVFRRDEYLLEQRTAYKYLSEIYKTTGKYKLAYQNEVLYKVMSDSILNLEKDKKITQMQMQYDFDKIQDKAKQVQDEKVVKLNQETDKQRIIKYIIMSALFCLTVLTLGLFSNLRKNEKQKIIITNQKDIVEQQNGVIQQSLTEKETLLREIHHRVKNNLQIISSLLNIQSQHISDEKVLSSIQEGQSRVQAMSLIHQSLYQSEHLSNVDIENYLRELVVYLSEMFADTNKSIVVEVAANNIQFDIDTAIPLGLIVNELVSNAYKYAFDEKESGKIAIKIKSNTAVDYELSVEDNGKGLPVDFDPKKCNSLGLKLVTILSRQLRGGVTFKTDNGTEFIINFKDIKAYQSSVI